MDTDSGTIEIPLSVDGVDVLNIITVEKEENAKGSGNELEQANAGEENIVEEHNEEQTLKKTAVSADREDKLVQLPIARVKRIMKMDPDVNSATQEAVFLIAKSTELFIQSFATEAYNYTVKGKRKTMKRRDIDAVIESLDVLAFLENVLDDLC